MAAVVTSNLDEAADVLRRGGLVAFPTETVYGLGASARDPDAVARIFAAKGRPADHPLIVHLARAEALDSWAVDVPAVARSLARAFWPGPLTLILRRAPGVLDAVTGGQETVGLRVPSHPVARQLLEAFGDGVAAPSANRFGRVSPTRAEHVLAELGDRVDRIVEGGSCEVGLESTIVDCSSGQAVILRPGGVTQEMLEASLGVPVPLRQTSDVRAPGQLPSHYAPRAQVILTSTGEVDTRARELLGRGARVGVLRAGAPAALPEGVTVVDIAADLETAARELYARLRQADDEGLDALLVVLPPEIGVGRAIADRLRRAAGPRPEVSARSPSDS